MAEKVEEVKAPVDEAQQQLEAITTIIKGQCTGMVEKWAGARGPMFNAFLKNKGLNPSGVKGYPTVADLVKATLENLRHSSYFIRFNFNTADGSGGKVEQSATLISYSEQGYLVFAGRERIQTTFSTSVEKVTPKAKVDGLQQDESGLATVDFTKFANAGASQVSIS